MSDSPARVTLMLTAPAWRGSGVSFIKIARGLESGGHPVRMVAGTEAVAEQLDAHGLVVDLVPGGGELWREVRAVRRTLAAHQAESVICDRPHDVRVARYASIAAGRRIIWRYNLHSGHLATDPFQRWLFGGVAHVVHQSSYSARRFVADAPWLNRLPSSVIPNGFDAGTLGPDPQRGREFRRRLGVGDDRFLVVTPTPDHPEKEVGVAEAAARLAAASLPITWVVAATGGNDRSSGIDVRRVGSLDQEDYLDLIRAADLVLLAAPRELFGNTAAESMALGAVVVAADAGAIPEVLGDTGMLFPAGDAGAAARAVVELAGDPARRAVLGAAARARIVESFPLAVMQRGYGGVVG